LKRILLTIFVLLASANLASPRSSDGIEVNDESYKFSVTLPDGWTKKDMKETEAKDGISYSFERSDKKCDIMLLAFKLQAVKNLDDFIYTMENDASLNIPKRTTDYMAQDAGAFDSKSALYQDNMYTENIYYFRTKLPDAPYNFVYMLRFITANKFISNDMDKQIKKIADSFLPTAQ